jgi:hypothetical protein
MRPITRNFPIVQNSYRLKVPAVAACITPGEFRRELHEHVLHGPRSGSSREQNQEGNLSTPVKTTLGQTCPVGVYPSQFDVLCPRISRIYCSCLTSSSATKVLPEQHASRPTGGKAITGTKLKCHRRLIPDCNFTCSAPASLPEPPALRWSPPSPSTPFPCSRVLHTPPTQNPTTFPLRNAVHTQSQSKAHLEEAQYAYLPGPRLLTVISRNAIATSLKDLPASAQAKLPPCRTRTRPAPSRCWCARGP